MDDEEYVLCGINTAKLEPTFELRWKVFASPGEPDVLQQRWIAQARMPDGSIWEEERWRDVPRTSR